jgi:hypothetical protein
MVQTLFAVITFFLTFFPFSVRSESAQSRNTEVVKTEWITSKRKVRPAFRFVKGVRRYVGSKVSKISLVKLKLLARIHSRHTALAYDHSSAMNADRCLYFIYRLKIISPISSSDDFLFLS